jgi:DNA-binding IscR family transcriptional regulator
MHPGACAQESSCHVREPWQRINQAVRDALDGITLADLAAPAPAPGSRSGSMISLESLGVNTRDLDTRTEPRSTS